MGLAFHPRDEKVPKQIHIGGDHDKVLAQMGEAMHAIAFGVKSKSWNPYTSIIASKKSEKGAVAAEEICAERLI